MKKAAKTLIAAFLAAVMSVGLLSPAAYAAGKDTIRPLGKFSDIPDGPNGRDDYKTPYIETPPEETLTGERFKEFLSSELAQSFSGLYKKRFFLSPLSGGKVEFSEPFRIPVYRKDAKNKFEPVMYTWYTAVIQDGEIRALLKLVYNYEVLPQRVEYLTYDMTESINSGNDLSLYIVYAEFDGKFMGEYNSLFYSIDKSGKSTLINKELNLDREVSNLDPLKTTKDDYALISGYNVLSRNMKKAASAENVYSADLKNGSKITLQNFGEKYIAENSAMPKYKSKRNFIIHEAGRDKNGEMTYKLSSVKSPDKTLKYGGYDKFYLRMASGSTEPEYRICPADAPNKALTLINGKLKVKKRTGAANQLWFISISD